MRLVKQRSQARRAGIDPMTQETTRPDPQGQPGGDSPPPPGSAADLDRMRAAYRGALESSRAWRSFTEETRHHDVTYWTLLTSLFADPGMNRQALVERIMDYAGVSRSTAERAVKEARGEGYVRDEPAGRE